MSIPRLQLKGGVSSRASTTSAEPAYIQGSTGVSGVTHNNCSISVRGHFISWSDQKETPPTHTSYRFFFALPPVFQQPQPSGGVS